MVTPRSAAGPRLILASASPRRRELLATLGAAFDVIPSDIDETGSLECRSARDLAADLAIEKARAVFSSHGDGGALVLAADTIVVARSGDAERVLGKPADDDDARGMLRLLSGRTHVVYTGLALATAGPDSPIVRSDCMGTEVGFRALTDEDIEAYVATREPFDKAGAYGIQGHASRFIEHIRGDYYNVVGLPLSRTAALLSAVLPDLAAAPRPPETAFAILPGEP